MSHKAKWRNYSTEELQSIVASCFSYRELAKKLGYAQDGGGTIKSLHKMCEELQISTAHFTGQGWNKQQYDVYALTTNSHKNRGKTFLATVLGVKQISRACENCGLSEWMGKPIPLQVHHINGIHSDNRIENLQVLCLNCHGQTESYCKPFQYR